MRLADRTNGVIWFLLAAAWVIPAEGAVNILLDFDDDNDPATVRTALPAGQLTATVRFILEVGTLPLPSGPFITVVDEGCCDAPAWEGHYGTSVLYGSITFDPAYVAAYSPAFPVCTYCCPWIIEAEWNPAAPVAAGGRYFIGEAIWDATCDVGVACTPPTSFVVSGDAIAGSIPMSFTCPVVAEEAGAWGSVKANWR